MVALERKVTQLLKKTFPPPDRVRVDDEDGLIGRVVSAKFHGVDPMDRQELIWKCLKAGLSEAEQRRIVTIIGITPVEEKLHMGSLL